MKSSFSATYELEAVDLVSADTGWAVGGGTFIGTSGNLVKLEGGVWTEVATDLRAPLIDVALVDADNGWAVGGALGDLGFEDAEPLLYQLQGGEWAEVEVDANTVLMAVALRDDGTGWAVGLNGVVVELSPEGASVCDKASFSDAHLLNVTISPQSGRALAMGEDDSVFWLD